MKGNFRRIVGVVVDSLRTRQEMMMLILLLVVTAFLGAVGVLLLTPEWFTR